jgi:hypothetical protein
VLRWAALVARIREWGNNHFGVENSCNWSHSSKWTLLTRTVSLIHLTLQSLLYMWFTNQFNIQRLYVLSTPYVRVYFTYLRIKSDLCHLQHKLIGFYNRDEKCLQRGTDWVFKWSSLRLCHLQHRLIGFYNRDEKCLQRGTDCVFKWSGLRLCHLQHKLIAFYNRDEKCLQRGTDWVFKCSVCVPSLKG